MCCEKEARNANSKANTQCDVNMASVCDDDAKHNPTDKLIRNQSRCFFLV